MANFGALGPLGTGYCTLIEPASSVHQTSVHTSNFPGILAVSAVDFDHDLCRWTAEVVGAISPLVECGGGGQR